MPKTKGRLIAVIAIAAVACLAALPAAAQLTTYSSRAAFEAANPGLPTETFEEAVFPSGVNSVTFPGPLDASTNNAVFSPGDILPNLRFVSFGGDSATLYARRPPEGLSGFSFPSVAMGPSYDTNALDIVFDTGVEAVGFDAWSEGTTPPYGGTFRIMVFDTSGTSLGMYDLDGFPPSTGGFFGVASTVPIGIVRVNSPRDGLNGGIEGVDNVSFGVVAEAVPAIASPGLAALGLLLAALGLVALRRLTA